MSSIEVSIPKEIRNYESKLVGPFSARKIVCLSVAIVGSVGMYQLQKIMGLERPSGMPCFLGALPGAIFIFKPYGMKMEKFLKAAFIDNFIAPKNRIYKVENQLSKYYGFIDDNEDSLELINLETKYKDDLENTSKEKEKKILTKNFNKQKAVIQKKIQKENLPTQGKNIPPELRGFL